MYNLLFKSLTKIFSVRSIFKFGFNFSPMYRRTNGRLKIVSEDLHYVKIEIALNYKNRNYVGSIFGGSLYSATDPIYMIQLIQILGDDYIVWDKSATINFKRPAKSKAYAEFEFSKEEIEDIKKQVEESGKLDIVKRLNIVSASGDIFSELEKTIYISTKAYYKARREARGK